MEQKEELNSEAVQDRSIPGSDDTSVRDPLGIVEEDIRRLMKEIGRKDHDIEELKDKSESDMKKLLLDIIAVVDAFENVFRNIEPRLEGADQQARIWVSNFKTVYRLLSRSLTSKGVVAVETIIGQKVNVYWHSISEVEENPDREDETILEENKRGYLWNGKLLRPAEVKVVKNG